MDPARTFTAPVDGRPLSPLGHSFCGGEPCVSLTRQSNVLQALGRKLWRPLLSWSLLCLSQGPEEENGSQAEEHV